MRSQNVKKKTNQQRYLFVMYICMFFSSENYLRVSTFH